jgi:hypothetical protein
MKISTHMFTTLQLYSIKLLPQYLITINVQTDHLLLPGKLSLSLKKHQLLCIILELHSGTKDAAGGIFHNLKISLQKQGFPCIPTSNNLNVPCLMTPEATFAALLC